MKRGISMRRMLAMGLVAVSLSACSMLGSGVNREAQTELNRQRRQWRAQEIGSYSYTVRRICFCAPPFTDPVLVRVRDGRVEGRSFVESGGAVDPTQAQHWPAVDGLFDLIQDAIDRDADAIAVEYHPQLGYPTSISIDYSQMMADEELSITAEGLTRQ